VRVSLTEDAIFEIPVAQQLVKPYNEGLPAQFERIENAPPISYDPFDYVRRESEVLTINGIKPAATKRFPSSPRARSGTPSPTRSTSSATTNRRSSSKTAASSKSTRVTMPPSRASTQSADAKLVTIKDGLKLPVIAAYRLLAAKLQKHPILLKDTLHPASSIQDQASDFTENLLTAATNIGSLLCDGIGDAVIVNGEDAPGPVAAHQLQHPAGRRRAHLQDRLRRLPELRPHALQSANHHAENPRRHRPSQRRAHRRHGLHRQRPRRNGRCRLRLRRRRSCKINLYVGKTAVKFNIPEEEAVERLIDLIKEHNRWFERAGGGVMPRVLHTFFKIEAIADTHDHFDRSLRFIDQNFKFSKK
jgi:(E)-4-hydroxy-3-methylbut-2-enyl-diphosphate synthase